jgi:flagellar basal body L-ring protein FlgH
MKTNLIILAATLLWLTSCSTYMNTLYRDFENQDRANAEIDIPDNHFDQFRNNKRHTSTEYNNVDKNITSANQKFLAPATKRQYKDEKQATKRYTASDLTDNNADGSLWAGSDPNAFLFSTNKSKNNGDIVQINVLPKLREEISMELKKAFPENPYEVRANAETKDGKDATDGKDPKDGKDTKDTKTSPKTAGTDPKAATGKEDGLAPDAHDKISGVVVEEINREHLLIKGRKNVLFKNRKRMVEIQALVSRKDIGDDDVISSDAILESNVVVVK